MRKIVVRGIVEVMNERQIEARNDSLRGALTKMSSVRESRGDENIIGFEPYVRTLAAEEQKPRRRRIFGFRERAQEASGIENDPLFEALREDGVDIDAL